MPKEKDSRLKRAGVSGFNKPKRTPSHPKKSHIVVAKEGSKVKLAIGEIHKKQKVVAVFKAHSKQFAAFERYFS